MHSFYDMIQMMESDRPLEEDWKKWALPAALAAGSLASAYRAVNYPTNTGSDRPAAASRETDEAPRKGDARWQRMAKVFGVGKANEDLGKRQSNHRLGIGGEVKGDSDKGFGIGGMGGKMTYPKKSATSDDANEYMR